MQGKVDFIMPLIEAMQCPLCGRIFHASVEFCEVDGTKLFSVLSEGTGEQSRKTCPICGKSFSSKLKFCLYCGAVLLGTEKLDKNAAHSPPKQKPDIVAPPKATNELKPEVPAEIVPDVSPSHLADTAVEGKDEPVSQQPHWVEGEPLPVVTEIIDLTPKTQPRSSSEPARAVFLIAVVILVCGICIKLAIGTHKTERSSSALNSPAKFKPPTVAKSNVLAPATVNVTPPEPEFNAAFAVEHAQAALKIKDYERGFKVWLTSNEPHVRRSGIALMLRSSGDLDYHIKRVTGLYHAFALLWRGHWNLEQAMTMNALGRTDRIVGYLKDAAACFKSVRDSGDTSAGKDLPESLKNAGGTYKFLLNTKTDPMFKPILNSLGKPK